MLFGNSDNCPLIRGVRWIECPVIGGSTVIMMQLTTEHRVSIVLHDTTNQNTTTVKNAFRARLPDRNPKIIVPKSEILGFLKSQGRNVFSTVKQVNIHEY